MVAWSRFNHQLMAPWHGGRPQRSWQGFPAESDANVPAELLRRHGRFGVFHWWGKSGIQVKYWPVPSLHWRRPPHRRRETTFHEPQHVDELQFGLLASGKTLYLAHLTVQRFRLRRNFNVRSEVFVISRFVLQPGRLLHHQKQRQKWGVSSNSSSGDDFPHL